MLNINKIGIIDYEYNYDTHEVNYVGELFCIVLYHNDTYYQFLNNGNEISMVRDFYSKVIELGISELYVQYLPGFFTILENRARYNDLSINDFLNTNFSIYDINTMKTVDGNEVSSLPGEDNSNVITVDGVVFIDIIKLAKKHIILDNPYTLNNMVEGILNIRYDGTNINYSEQIFDISATEKDLSYFKDIIRVLLEKERRLNVDR